ncbi:hypothetical protein MMC25_007620 [Agyrium rufum]|nr:hypothetical protein [Agyrium rufum]
MEAAASLCQVASKNFYHDENAVSILMVLTRQHAKAEDKVWGAAYRIEASKVREVQEYLDIREINGYSIQYTPFHPADDLIGPISRTMVYIGLPDNPQFMGPQEPQRLAEHISRSRGPSGENTEYLLMLETALAALSPESGDAHVEDLARRIREIRAHQSTQNNSNARYPEKQAEDAATT